jgi:ribonuclease Z
MIFEVTILGCGAAAPTTKHNPSAQVVNVHDKLFLVDCGEGTQMQLRHQRIKFQRIHHIFISHLHGDHYLGLVGLICSFHLLGRKSELHIYGPDDLKTLIEINLKLSDTFLNFPLIFHATEPKVTTLLYEDATLTVESIPLKHRIECTGFLFREKEHVPRIKKARVIEHRLQPTQVLALKRGESVVLSSGEELTSAEACHATPERRSYAYCSDTAYKEDLVDQLKGVDLLYHEATFIESEAERAKFTFHSTAKQAATIAQKAEAKELLLGHFSSRYKSEQAFLEEASEIFPNTLLADEGKTFAVGQSFEIVD